MDKYDFSGWATKANIKCFDGRTILPNAFKCNDGQIVPLVWGHDHDDPYRVLGHALLENREDGVYAYGTFNDTDQGQNAKQLVMHGDISALSVYANSLKQDSNKNVAHGCIRELSLVLAGANPGAFIDSVLCHGENSEEEAYISFVENASNIEIQHSENEFGKGDNNQNMENDVIKPEDDKNNESLQHAATNVEPNKQPDPVNNDDSGETYKDIWNTLTDKQKDVAYAIIEAAVQEELKEKNNNQNSSKGEQEMKHNVFEGDNKNNSISHDAMVGILEDAKRCGSLKMAVANYEEANKKALSHSVEDADGNAVTYGVADINYLFPDARNVNTAPDFIKRNTEWVGKVIGGAKHTPFSRIKSVHADITMEEARARGYAKGTQKVEEVFSLLKRTTNPTTVYKKQKLDRDDIVDITDFDVVMWLKSEMRGMLDEELARAALIGDGRIAGADGKISEDCIRPIYKDAALYSVKKSYTPAAGDTDEDKAKKFIKTAIKSRKDYKGSGNPTLFTTEETLTNCLLIEDANGRVIYDSVEKLKNALRVKDIVTVEPMENITREGTGSDTNTYTLEGIIVNMEDYKFGSDKGGEVNFFDDFDIDFNQQKYLIEARCSGALTKPYSAVVIESAVASI